jgi:hypothetical protein
MDQRRAVRAEALIGLSQPPPRRHLRVGESFARRIALDCVLPFHCSRSSLCDLKIVLESPSRFVLRRLIDVASGEPVAERIASGRAHHRDPGARFEGVVDFGRHNVTDGPTIDVARTPVVDLRT